jgi:hypothetical protein
MPEQYLQKELRPPSLLPSHSILLGLYNFTKWESVDKSDKEIEIRILLELPCMLIGYVAQPELPPVSQNHVTLLQMEAFCIIHVCLICLAVCCFHSPFILPKTTMGHIKTLNNIKTWLKHHHSLSRFIQSGVLCVCVCENWRVTLRTENRVLTDLYWGVEDLGLGGRMILNWFSKNKTE